MNGIQEVTSSILVSSTRHLTTPVVAPTVAVAQLVERQIVVLDVAGSNPVGHPFNFVCRGPYAVPSAPLTLNQLKSKS